MDGSPPRRSRLRQTVIFCLPFYKRCDTRTAILCHYLCQGAHRRPGNIRCRLFLQVWYGKSCEINTYMTELLAAVSMIESLGKIRVPVQSRIHKLQITSSNVWLFDSDSQLLETNPSARAQSRTNELPITSSDVFT